MTASVEDVTDPVVPFDACGPLPIGTTVLEASAGTGKTHAIGDLVTRYVAEGVARPEQLLVITFGRAASQELRERVRGHLVAAERALARPDRARDPVHRLLATGTAEEVRIRRDRLRAALATYDASTILTTHQFCQFVLTGLGVAGDADPDVELVETLDDLVVQVVDDLFVGAFARRDLEPVFDRATALMLARKAIDDPQAQLQPVDADPKSPANWRVRFAQRVRQEVERRKRRRRILGYDDLLVRLASALEPDEAPARLRMRQRWSFVLVDEFQDTDPVQWQILDRAFSGHATMVLIGDPKQSIYAFRGGDVQTYLVAAGTAGQARATLARNWRTDAPLVDALQVLLHDLALGSPEIRVRPVESALPGTRLAGAPSAAPLRLRVTRRDDLACGPGELIPIARAREFIARDLAADLSELLGSGATFAGEPVRAGHVAVIVGTHKQARTVQSALVAVGVPAVVAGSVSVFQTEAADQWVTLLEALEQPHRAARVRAAALTAFVGWPAARLATGSDGSSDPATDELSVLISNWAGVLAGRGVAALLEVIGVETDLPGRVLGLIGGERLLTDLRHVGQLLQAVAVQDGLGVAALAEWLRRRRADDGADITTDRVRRLETDAAATQVVTLHASKGLQYPVVYLPFAFDRHVVSDPDLLLLHQDGRRVLDVGGPNTPGRSRRRQQALAEEAGEALRHLYVGLTRAQAQVVTWWAPTANTPASGLHRVLFGERDFDGGVPDSVRVPSDEAAATRLGEWQHRGALVIERIGVSVARPRPAPTAAPAELAVGALNRDLEQQWRRVSYSSLAAAGSSGILLGRPVELPGGGPVSEPGVGSEPEFTERADEEIGGLPAPPVSADDGLRAIASPMAGLPVGADFGTLVHAVLETTDPRAADLAAEVRARSAEQLARSGFPLDAGELADALVPVLRSPLGPTAGGWSLADIDRRDRLTELAFELPLAGGDAPATGAADLTLGQVAPLLRRHLPPDDPFAGYADRLASPEFAGLPLRGYLTGSLDAVLRLPGPRYLVADYKTNWLADLDASAALTLWDYRPAAVDQVMAGSDYPLQALLYTVALHRFLRWRQPGYVPATHLGGVLYLFVRGMAGPDTPIVDGRPCGVFAWVPPVGLVTGLSDLLDGGPS